MSKIIVIDNGNIMHKAIFAFRNNYGVPATYTYMTMIVSYLKKVDAKIEDTIIIAEDFGSWRKKIDPTYKAQRKAFREDKESAEWWATMYKEFNDFFPKLNVSTNWHFIKLYKMEADDIAACATRYFKDQEVILVSSDKDWEMLCAYPNVKIFSPISKKFKVVPAPMKVLMEKIHGDISDNLLDKPSSEFEFERRKKIVNLLELPLNVELMIKEQLDKIAPKNLVLHKIPYRTVRERINKLYFVEKETKVEKKKPKARGNKKSS